MVLQWRILSPKEQNSLYRAKKNDYWNHESTFFNTTSLWECYQLRELWSVKLHYFFLCSHRLCPIGHVQKVCFFYNMYLQFLLSNERYYSLLWFLLWLAGISRDFDSTVFPCLLLLISIAMQRKTSFQLFCLRTLWTFSWSVASQFRRWS